jgi:hypothetical protein
VRNLNLRPLDPQVAEGVHRCPPEQALPRSVGFGEIGGHPRKGPKSVRLAYALAYDRPDIRFVCFTRLRERPWHGKRHELAELTQGPRRTVVNLFAWSDQIENGADVNGESSTTTRRRNLGQTARRKRRSRADPRWICL